MVYTPAGATIAQGAATLLLGGRLRIGRRVRASQARAQGVKLGRKARIVDLRDLQARRAQGQSWRQIARAMSFHVRTLRRRLKPWQKSPG